MRIYTMPKHARTETSAYITLPEHSRITVLRVYRRMRDSGINSSWARWHAVDLIGVGMHNARYSFEESK